MSELHVGKKYLLSFSTSEKDASVCITSGQELAFSVDFNQWAESAGDQSTGKSTSLVPMIRDAIGGAGLVNSDIEALALTYGPGRFTGLRVGVVTARMLAYAWNLPLVAVNSLQVVADKLRLERTLPIGSKIWAITDAQRRQVFAARFEVGENFSLKVCIGQSLFERAAVTELVQEGEHVTGSGAYAFAEQLQQKSGNELPDPSVAMCDAVGVAVLAQPRINDKDFDDPLKIQPLYFRPSAAEEVRLAKESQGSP